MMEEMNPSVKMYLNHGLFTNKVSFNKGFGFSKEYSKLGMRIERELLFQSNL